MNAPWTYISAAGGLLLAVIFLVAKNRWLTPLAKLGLEKLVQWFSTSKDKPLAYAVKKLPKIEDVQGKRCIVCSAGEFKLQTLEIPPDKLNAGEVCWIVPKNEVEVVVLIDNGERVLELRCLLMFQADNTFAEFVRGKNELTLVQLSDLVLAAWNTMQEIQPLPLTRQNFTEAQNKECRARLSALLTLNGFRCTSLHGLWKDKSTPAASQPLPADEVKEVMERITLILKRNRTRRNWNHLTAALGKTGFVPSFEEKSQLKKLGEDLFQNKQNAEQCAAKITEMLVAARNRKVRLDTELYWDAEAVRTRIKDEYSAELTPLTSQAVDVSTDRKKPWLLFTFQQKSIDAKLTTFLSANVNDWLVMIRGFESQANFRLSAVLMPVKQTVERLQQHMATLPRLTDKHSSLQKKQVPLKETVDAVQQTVPLAETVSMQLRKMMSEQLPQEQFTEQTHMLVEILTQLETEIQTRKNIYN